jgi:hypothetical protein
VPPGQLQLPPAPEHTWPPLQSAVVQQVAIGMHAAPHAF